MYEYGNIIFFSTFYKRKNKFKTIKTTDVSCLYEKTNYQHIRIYMCVYLFKFVPVRLYHHQFR